MERVFGIRGGGTGPDGGAFLEICFFRFWRTEDDPGALGLGGSALVVVGTLTGPVTPALPEGCRPQRLRVEPGRAIRLQLSACTSRAAPVTGPNVKAPAIPVRN